MVLMNLYVHLVRLHQVEKIPCVQHTLMDIIHRMVEVKSAKNVQKVTFVHDEIRIQLHAILEKYLVKGIQYVVNVTLATIHQLKVERTV